MRILSFVGWLVLSHLGMIRLINSKCYDYYTTTDDNKGDNNGSNSGSSQLAKAFRFLRTDISNCPPDRWMFQLTRIPLPSSRNNTYVLMNIGFNKGLNFGLWASVFAPELSIGLADWFDEVNGTAQGHVDCGCRGCDEIHHERERMNTLKTLKQSQENNRNHQRNQGSNVISKPMMINNQSLWDRSHMKIAEAWRYAADRSGIRAKYTSFIQPRDTSLLNLKNPVDSGKLKSDVPKLKLIGVDINHQNIDLVHHVANEMADKNDLWKELVSIDLFQVVIAAMKRKYWVPKFACGGNMTKFLETCSIIPDKWLPKSGPPYPERFRKHNFEIEGLTLIEFFQLLQHGQRGKSQLISIEDDQSFTKARPTNGKLAPHFMKLQQKYRNKLKPPKLEAVENRLEIKVASVPEWPAHQVYPVDLLLIDVEGHDGSVMMQSESLWRSHSVRLVVFEYHSLCPWPLTRLGDVVKMMSSNGYECFFDAETGLWPISNDCWHDWFEFHEYSNVICVLRDDPWHAVLSESIVSASFVEHLRKWDPAFVADRERNITLAIETKKQASQRTAVC